MKTIIFKRTTYIYHIHLIYIYFYIFEHPYVVGI